MTELHLPSTASIIPSKSTRDGDEWSNGTQRKVLGLDILERRERLIDVVIFHQIDDLKGRECNEAVKNCAKCLPNYYFPLYEIGEKENFNYI